MDVLTGAERLGCGARATKGLRPRQPRAVGRVAYGAVMRGPEPGMLGYVCGRDLGLGFCQIQITI